MSHLVLTFLGPPLIELYQQQITFPTRKATALLVYLSVTGRPHARDTLSTLFWPELNQARARASLRHALWILGRAGFSDWLQTDQEIVRFKLGYQLDVADFQEKINQSLLLAYPAENVSRAHLPLLVEAIDLYKGSFLSGFSLRDSPEFDHWQRLQAEDLRLKLATAFERLADIYHFLEEWDDAISNARRWVDLDPLHEPAQRELIRLYARSGKRGMALKQYDILRRTLDQELAVEPETESQVLYQELLKGRPLVGKRTTENSLAPETEPQPNNNLPAALTSFIGRKREVSDIRAALFPSKNRAPSIRLLTVSGPGGVGKTRLALEAASGLVEVYPGGVWLVELAGLSDPELVVRAVFTGLSIQEQPGNDLVETLAAALRARHQVLLLLDNCEHLLGACAEMCISLLKACPELQILATSRQVLGVNGEATWMLRGLSLPGIGNTEVSNSEIISAAKLPVETLLEESEALQLFLERGRRVQPQFKLTEENKQSIVQICQRLDGLPLSLELAAARLNVLSPQMIASRLDEGFLLLQSKIRDGAVRHQTLQGVIDWSYRLLSPEERTLFNRLSVFQGGFSLEAAEAVCTHGESRMENNQREMHCLSFVILHDEVFRLLTSLVEKSMVIADMASKGEVRYRLLETLRQYGQVCLNEKGELKAIQERHAHFFTALAEQADPKLRSPDQFVWLEILEKERDNLRAALEYCSKYEVKTGLGLSSALWWFWILRSNFTEGRKWMEMFLSSKTASLPEFSNVRSYTRYAYLMKFLVSEEQLHLIAGESLRRSSRIEDMENIAISLVLLAGDPYYTLDTTKSRQFLEQGLDLFYQTGNSWWIATTIRNLAELANVCLYDFPEAKRLCLESLALSREIGDRYCISRALWLLGDCDFSLGNWESATDYFQDSLFHMQALNDRWGTAFILWRMARTQYVQREYEKAEVFLWEGLEIFREINNKKYISYLLSFLADLARLQGRIAQAVELCQESLNCAEALENQLLRVDPLFTLAEIAQNQGDDTTALRLYRDVLAIERSYLLRPNIVIFVLEALAKLSLDQSQFTRAAKLLGSTEKIRKTIHFIPPPQYSEIWESSLTEASKQLDKPSFIEAWTEGQGMTLEQAVDYVLAG